MKKNYIYIGILVVLIAVLAVSRVGHMGYATAQFEPTTTATTSNLGTSAKHASILVAHNLYAVPVLLDETVLEAMRAYASTTDFAFMGKDYPSLGFFVESIGGKKNADGFYWILYVNGKSSDLGASVAHVRAGDTIEWRYEKGY